MNNVALRCEDSKAVTTRFLDPSNNILVGNKLDEVWDRLDYGPRNAALAKLDRKLELKLEAEINSVLSDHVEAAFYLGWQAAKNPAAWLFASDGRLTDESPQEIYREKMDAMGFGHKEVFCIEGELGDAIVYLVTEAEDLAFQLGWEVQHYPESLVFEPESLFAWKSLSSHRYTCPGDSN